MEQWGPDFLGPGFEQRALGDGATAIGTLVRHRLRPTTAGSSGPALVYVHGWSDYYFNTELARFASDHGWRFYALDLPEHGRSLRPGGRPGFVPSAAHYLLSIGAAIDVVRDEGDGPMVLMGHSTGGLAVALEAQRRPERLAGLVLSSPWLAPYGGRTAGAMLEWALGPNADARPERIIPLPPRGHYWRAIARQAGGEWDVREDLRPRAAFPVRVGWLRGVLAAQRELADGPRIAVPALLLASTRSDTGLVWREHMRSRDAVLAIAPMRRAAAAVCASLDEVLVDGGLHDVLLSAPAVRREAYVRLGAWLDALVAPTDSAGR
ncbi:alpha/beta hydrolase [Sinomonas sp. ASV322]|uniref:alpha/beta hydrolase n=1 Tax=Sinomonas sp. ASV322 TaxID=3041920 RepID=UPI0027DCECEA|nr:alpha/beta hydrolase [Sinomonas sp. ASV322]MDQ4501092.1 alpha/beta hydrolase [Sinomonas sp. ASV322]